ncbi:MAG TPA: hypothetical protein V6C82_06905, partial [Chroococcales cyanobacterium]
MKITGKAALIGAILLSTGCDMSGLPVVGGMFANDYCPLKKDSVWFFLRKDGTEETARTFAKVNEAVTNG